MIGTGTIINAALLLAGGVLGLLLGKYLTKSIQNTLIKACGLSTVLLGASGCLSALFEVSGKDMWHSGSMMMIACLCLGGFIGELIGIERGLERFGKWLKNKTHSENDANFMNGFVTASLIVSIGAMAVIGPFEDALHGDYSILISKGILDLTIVFALSSTYGKGPLFSVIPVVVIQGFFTVCAFWIEPLLSEAAINNLSIVGSALITGVGINLIFEKTFPLANYLPAVVLAVLWGLFI